MWTRLLAFVLQAFANQRDFIWKTWYQFLASTYPQADWTFMNYGYAPLAGPERLTPLDPEDESNSYCIQLYQQAVDDISLTDLTVMEVGCGRGGGADYLCRYFKPQKLIGVDFSASAIAFCQRTYQTPQLSFKVGNAQALPFADQSFDVVINVESSHCYPDFSQFIREAKRVLRDGGYFIFADFREKSEFATLQNTLNRSGLIQLREQDITPNVLRALALDSDKKTTRIKKLIHKPLQNLFYEFAGTQNSQLYHGFQQGDLVYASYILQKARAD
ncbi:MAG: class I SAM-dependent methyltransferase [Cyanobacteria bacterium P01_H01_bin.15]